MRWETAGMQKTIFVVDEMFQTSMLDQVKKNRYQFGKDTCSVCPQQDTVLSRRRKSEAVFWNLSQYCFFFSAEHGCKIAAQIANMLCERKETKGFVALFTTTTGYIYSNAFTIMSPLFSLSLLFTNNRFGTPISLQKQGHWETLNKLRTTLQHGVKKQLPLASTFHFHFHPYFSSNGTPSIPRIIGKFTRCELQRTGEIKWPPLYDTFFSAINEERRKWNGRCGKGTKNAGTIGSVSVTMQVGGNYKIRKTMQGWDGGHG